MEKKPMGELSFTELLKLQKYFIKERGYLVPDVEFGGSVPDRLAPKYQQLTIFIEDIDTAISDKFSQYSVDVN